MHQASQVVNDREPPRFFWRAWFDVFAQRYPIVALAAVVLASNLAATFFNVGYNYLLIVPRFDEEQAHVFWTITVPVYNTVAFPLFMVIGFSTLLPTMRVLDKLRRGAAIEAAALELGQRRLINFPLVQLIVNPIGWFLAAFCFPWMVTTLGGPGRHPVTIWWQFGVSFFVGMVFTTVQTFFLVQSYLTAYLYPDFFRDTRPESVPGIVTIPFWFRLLLLFLAIALMPMIALLTLTLNTIGPDDENQWQLVGFAFGLVIISTITGGGIFGLVGRDLLRWIQLQTHATGQIAQGNFDIRIEQPRPDEWGWLNNRFNDMADALGKAWESHETLGQLVSPEVRDQILRRSHGFEVVVQEITVLFVDIRGFTTRCAGADPARIGALLNRFLTLALGSIEEKGGYVNKFLGDGVMALFGATHPTPDHADLAVASAREMLARLAGLNAELAREGEAPLLVGIGIHTGEALVGCFGATVQGGLMRREFTAIGDTVNFCQRIEQLTKKCGGPILLSESTRARLRREWPLDCLGPQELLGSPQPMVVYCVGAG